MKPCPENPVAKTRFAQSGCVSIMKSSSGVSCRDKPVRKVLHRRHRGYAHAEKNGDVRYTQGGVCGHMYRETWAVPCRAAQSSRLHAQTREIHTKPDPTLRQGKSGICPAETDSHRLVDNTQPVAVLRLWEIQFMRICPLHAPAVTITFFPRKRSPSVITSGYVPCQLIPITGVSSRTSARALRRVADRSGHRLKRAENRYLSATKLPHRLQS